MVISRTIRPAHGAAAAALPRFASAATLVGVMATLMIPISAVATEGDHEVWLGLDAAMPAAVGTQAGSAAGLSARYRYGWTDFWAIGVTLQHRQKLTQPLTVAAMSTAVLADVRLTLDALTWVPSVAVGLGGTMAGFRGIEPLLHVEGVLAYRPARDWAIQIHLGMEQALDASWLRPTIGVSYGWISGKAGKLDF